MYIAEVYYPLLLHIIFNPFVRYSRAGDLKFYTQEEVSNVLRDTGFLNEPVIIVRNIQIIQGYK